jgi:hypothetical protein
MLKILSVFILSILGLGMTSCDAQSKTNTDAPNQMQVNSMQEPNFKSDCEKWQQFYEQLSQEEKNILRDEGIVGSSVGDDDYGYILSPELVKDCRLRLEIGRYIQRIMTGKGDGTDAEFADENSKEIVRVLRHIWKGYYFSGDGAASEKYGLLWNKGLKEEDVAPFISELLKTEGLLKSDLIYVLITRPMPSLKPVISELLQDAENRRDISKQVYALIILQQASPEPKFLSKLEIISQNKKLSAKTKKGILEVIRKFKSGEKVIYDDIENLGLALDE